VTAAKAPHEGDAWSGLRAPSEGQAAGNRYGSLIGFVEDATVVRLTKGGSPNRHPHEAVDGYGGFAVKGVRVS
jgi:hypothetical protein